MKGIRFKNIGPAATRRLGLVFVLFILVFETYVVRVDFAQYFAYLIDSEKPFFVAVTLACLCISIYLFYNFVTASLTAEWPYKVLYFVIFAGSVFAEYGYQKALGRSTGRLDIETALDTTSEQMSASILMYVNFYAVVPCIIFLMILVLVDTRKTSGLKAFLLANVLLIGCFLVTPVLIDQKFPTISTAAFYRTCTEFLTQNPVSNRVFAAHNGDARARREVLKPALTDDFRPSNNIVVVVDESVRGDHLSLNGYDRDTTPFLREMYRRGILTNWGIASSASTGSRYTYNALITGLTPNDFPDKSDTRITTFPTLFQYAKAMRYRTYFFDGQMKDYWGANYDDKRWIDAWSGPKEIADGRGFAPYELDNLIARKINALVTASAGNFIFVFKHGSHMPYSSDFPADAAYWQPSYRTDNTFDIPQSADLPAVVNSYDNSLRYNIDSFFRNLIDDYANIPNNTVILYTGDHGQTLFANGRAAHGGSTKEEATVPLFIVGKLAAPPDTRYRASHQNLFPTILDLIAYPQELRNWTDVPSLLKAGAADSKQRSFNPDLGLKVAFD